MPKWTVPTIWQNKYQKNHLYFCKLWVAKFSQASQATKYHQEENLGIGVAEWKNRKISSKISYPLHAEEKYSES